MGSDAWLMISPLVLTALGLLAGLVGVVFGLVRTRHLGDGPRRRVALRLGVAAVVLGLAAALMIDALAAGRLGHFSAVSVSPFGVAVLTSPCVVGGAAVVLGKPTLGALMLAVVPTAVCLAVLVPWVGPGP